MFSTDAIILGLTISYMSATALTFLKTIFDLGLFESENAEPVDTKGRLYIKYCKTSIFYLLTQIFSYVRGLCLLSSDFITFSKLNLLCYTV